MPVIHWTHRIHSKNYKYCKDTSDVAVREFFCGFHPVSVITGESFCNHRLNKLLTEYELDIQGICGQRYDMGQFVW